MSSFHCIILQFPFPGIVIDTTIDIAEAHESLLTEPAPTKRVHAAASLPQPTPYRIVIPPTSITLLSESKTSSGPRSVCHHQGNTYVGCKGN